RHEGAVGVGEEAANLLRAVGDASMHFPDPEDGVFRAGLAGGALDLTWRVQLDRDRAGNRAQGLAHADDARDRLLVHVVLQRDDITSCFMCAMCLGQKSMKVTASPALTIFAPA